ncbi:MAG: hypothetical protein AAGC57_04760 [Pseudomonadota bacterium]
MGETTAPAPGALWRMVHIAVIAAILLVGFRLLIPAQFIDPFVRHDDYLALNPEPGLYYWKTLAKGRWITWLWTLRSAPTDPVVVWWLYLGIWCTGAAAIAVGVFRADRWPFRALLAAAAIALMPQAADISTWFAATAPASAGVTLMALLACLGPVRAVYTGLFVLVPATLMAHSSYPLLVLLAAALAADWRGDRHAWIRLPAAFLAALMLSIAMIIGLNGLVHDRFGIDAGSWMEENPVQGVGDLLVNLEFALGWLLKTLALMSNGQAAIGVMLLILAAVALTLAGVRSPRRALPVLSSAILAMAIGAAPAVLDGVDTPSRATGFLWLAIIGAFALAIATVRRPARRMIFIAGLVVPSLGATIFWHKLYEDLLAPYQHISRAIAEQVVAQSQGPPSTVVLWGQVHGLPSTEALQFSHGLIFRLQRLTGARTVVCAVQSNDTLKFVETDQNIETAPQYGAWIRARRITEGICDRWARPVWQLPVYPAKGWIGPLAPGVVGIRLPSVNMADVPP